MDNTDIIDKKMNNKNMNLSFINSNREEYTWNLDKIKNKSMNEDMKVYLSKNENKLVSSRNSLYKKDKIFNDIKLNKSIISADKTNNNYNEIKNHALVTLNTINLEKLKIQKKLSEYNKLIDKKIIKLKKNNKAKKINVYKRKKSSLIKEGNICNINSSKIYLINNKKINKAFFINSFGLNKQNTKRESNTNPTKKK